MAPCSILALHQPARYTGVQQLSGVVARQRERLAWLRGAAVDGGAVLAKLC